MLSGWPRDVQRVPQLGRRVLQRLRCPVPLRRQRRLSGLVLRRLRRRSDVADGARRLPGSGWSAGDIAAGARRSASGWTPTLADLPERLIPPAIWGRVVVPEKVAHQFDGAPNVLDRIAPLAEVHPTFGKCNWDSDQNIISRLDSFFGFLIENTRLRSK